ncbi:ankyrin repeat domain-containing protein [Thiotrichales bacterium 19S9-12]|nr:ankyrin repeat domain-containing protein [Thiotrichales bacterium 19S9-11]MCF6812577.1 ankyrin repeat domain-containing protein [Thiotrichales bacterium 19S9-12]
MKSSNDKNIGITYIVDCSFDDDSKEFTYYELQRIKGSVLFENETEEEYGKLKKQIETEFPDTDFIEIPNTLNGDKCAQRTSLNLPGTPDFMVIQVEGKLNDKKKLFDFYQSAENGIVAKQSGNNLGKGNVFFPKGLSLDGFKDRFCQFELISTRLYNLEVQLDAVFEHLKMAYSDKYKSRIKYRLLFLYDTETEKQKIILVHIKRLDNDNFNCHEIPKNEVIFSTLEGNYIESDWLHDWGKKASNEIINYCAQNRQYIIHCLSNALLDDFISGYSNEKKDYYFICPVSREDSDFEKYKEIIEIISNNLNFSHNDYMAPKELLFDVIYKGDVGKLIEVLAAKKISINFNYESHSNQSAIHFAAELGRFDMVKALIKMGSCYEYLELLSRGIMHGRIDFVKKMINSELKKIDKEHDFSIHQAIEFGQYAIAVMLINDGSADINQKNIMNEAPIHIAIKSNDMITLKHLISSGANINLVGSLKYQNPIIMALDCNNTEALKMLIESSAIIDQSVLDHAEFIEKKGALIKYIFLQSEDRSERQNQQPSSIF